MWPGGMWFPNTFQVVKGSAAHNHRVVDISQEVQGLPVTRIMAKEECMEKIFGQGLVCWSFLSWKQARLQPWMWGAAGVALHSHHEQFSTTILSSHSQGATFFLSAQLCADSSLARGQNVSPKHHMWVLNIWNLKTWGDSHMVDRVACSLSWEGDPWSGHCHCALPADGHLAFLSLFPAQNFHPPNGCRTWICWCCSYLQSTAARSSELNSLSCQWAPVSLEPILFNIRAYSCSYSLAFLLL